LITIKGGLHYDFSRVDTYESKLQKQGTTHPHSYKSPSEHGTRVSEISRTPPSGSPAKSPRKASAKKKNTAAAGSKSPASKKNEEKSDDAVGEDKMMGKNKEKRNNGDDAKGKDGMGGKNKGKKNDDDDAKGKLKDTNRMIGKDNGTRAANKKSGPQKKKQSGIQQGMQNKDGEWSKIGISEDDGEKDVRVFDYHMCSYAG
jgi:hypothetical protein